MIEKIINVISRRFTQKLIPVLESQQYPSINQQIQTSLISQWLLAKKQNIAIYSDIKDAGFRCYSQYEEDGIILYLLTMVGTKSRKVVEICCGRGEECMATNLIINHGFKGYLFDGDKNNVASAKKFFSRQKDCLSVEPEIKQAWFTRDNVNNLLIESGVEGEVDLLSIDIDGNDYYIWEAIDAIRPRVCVFETHDIIPTDLALTIPNSDDFFAMDKDVVEREFRSVSLKAMDKLSKRKNYTLVGSHKHGFNVFYVRNDLLNDLLPLPALSDIHDNEWTKYGQSKRWPLVQGHPWVEV